MGYLIAFLGIYWLFKRYIRKAADNQSNRRRAQTRQAPKNPPKSKKGPNLKDEGEYIEYEDLV